MGFIFHNSAVQEVVDYLQNGKLFSGRVDRGSLEKHPALLIDTLYNVERYQDPDFTNSLIADPLCWNDISSEWSAPYFEASKHVGPKEHAEHRGRIHQMFASCWPAAETQAILRLGERHASDLSGNLNSFLYLRAARGVIPCKFENDFWNILKLGGYPCGWVGGSDGKLVVFVPPE